MITDPQSAVGGQGRKRRWNLGVQLRSELTALASPPTELPVSTTLCLPQGPPTVSSQVTSHSSQPHQGMPRSPGSQCHLAPLSPPEAAPEAKFLPSPKHFFASKSLGGGPGTTLASDPPHSLTEEPPPSHLGKQSPSLTQAVRWHSATSSTSAELPTAFPGSRRRISREERLGTEAAHPPATQATRFPQLPIGSRSPRGKLGLRQGLEGVPSLLGKVPSVLTLPTCPQTPPTSLLWT